MPKSDNKPPLNFHGIANGVPQSLLPAQRIGYVLQLAIKRPKTLPYPTYTKAMPE